MHRGGRRSKVREMEKTEQGKNLSSFGKRNNLEDGNSFLTTLSHRGMVRVRVSRLPGGMVSCLRISYLNGLGKKFFNL